jgi:leucyl aminopeptidase (aminopeptidase T)
MAGNTGFIKKAGLLFNSSLEKAVSIIIKKNLAVRHDEKLLIVYDSKKSELAKKFRKVASELVDNVELLKIPESKVNGEEPPAEAARKFLGYDAIIFLTSKSLSHTKARRNASAKGARIASMPNVTRQILRRSIDIDYGELKKNAKKVGSALNKAKKVRIKTQFGSDFEFSIKGRQAHGLSAGIYAERGKWGNLPEGEVFIAPTEGTANGNFVVDGSVANFGKVSHPLIFFVENGFVKKITDGKKPQQIEKLLDSVGKNARNIAEFGIGLNKKAKVTGVVLEDEKVYGTCHIALGNNIGFGGKVDVPLHIDCVIRKPTIYLDGKIIMKKGKLIL